MHDALEVQTVFKTVRLKAAPPDTSPKIFYPTSPPTGYLSNHQEPEGQLPALTPGAPAAREFPAVPESPAAQAFPAVPGFPTAAGSLTAAYRHRNRPGCIITVFIDHLIVLQRKQTTRSFSKPFQWIFSIAAIGK